MAMGLLLLVLCGCILQPAVKAAAPVYSVPYCGPGPDASIDANILWWGKMLKAREAMTTSFCNQSVGNLYADNMWASRQYVCPQSLIVDRYVLLAAWELRTLRPASCAHARACARSYLQVSRAYSTQRIQNATTTHTHAPTHPRTHTHTHTHPRTHAHAHAHTAPRRAAGFCTTATRTPGRSGGSWTT